VADPLLPALLTRCRFPLGGTVVACAVSGGADSLALLILAVAAGLDATAIHVDHGLRAGSADEAQVVEEAAARLGAAFEGRSVIVAPGPNLEARARAARYGALPAGVLTGHTADDLAETMLVNLVRGAGRDGLSPMRPNGRVVRPLLGLRRAETRALCRARGLVPVEDPSNRDPRFTRNRVRHELLPLLEEIGGRDLVPILVRQAQLLGAEAAFLDREAAALDPTDARALAAAPEVLARRAIRAWLRTTDDERHPPTAAEVDRVLAVARGGAVACQVTGDRRVRRSQGRLTLTAGTARPATEAGRGEDPHDLDLDLDAVLIGGRERRQIVIVDYSAEWPRRFEIERERIEAALGPGTGTVEHIGSTAVPGLAAKPIVDILVTVEDVDDEGSYRAPLEGAGYVLRVREPGHRMFRTPRLDVHLHVWSAGSEEAGRILMFRDWLRCHADDRALYARTKRELAGQWPDMNYYAQAKSAVISRIMARAQCEFLGGA